MATTLTAVTKILESIRHGRLAIVMSAGNGLLTEAGT